MRPCAEAFVERGIRVLAGAANGQQALEEIGRHCPDVALLDVGMPGLGGMEAARHLHDLAPPTRLLLYTGNADAELMAKALRTGARGLILKDAPLGELARAVQIVAAGGTYIDPSLAGESSAQRSSSEQPTLKPRELAVLHLLERGHTNDQVGAELSISPDTV